MKTKKVEGRLIGKKRGPLVREEIRESIRG